MLLLHHRLHQAAVASGAELINAQSLKVIVTVASLEAALTHATFLKSVCRIRRGMDRYGLAFRAIPFGRARCAVRV